MGVNTAVEICRWTKSALKGGPHCYKRWYGIASHRCIQMTPNLNLCNYACSFCWRIHEEGRFKANSLWDDPRGILDGVIKAQRELLVGFKGNPEVDRERFLEAMFPRHVAISLDGEPAMYPMLPDLVREVRSRGMTAFLVTNGSIPQRLREMLEGGCTPHNLYISVYGGTREVFQRAASPLFKGAWNNLLESLSLMKDFEERGSRTVFRMTMVRGLNMVDPSGYARLVSYSQPMFVELKGYTWVGESTKRLPKTAMPTLEELGVFASRIAEETGYKVKMLDDKSRVVMLVRDEEAWQKSLGWVREVKRRINELDKPWRKRYLEEGREFKLVKTDLLEPAPGWV